MYRTVDDEFDLDVQWLPSSRAHTAEVLDGDPVHAGATSAHTCAGSASCIATCARTCAGSASCVATCAQGCATSSGCVTQNCA